MYNRRPSGLVGIVFKLSLLVFIFNLFKENLKASEPSKNINININITISILIINININIIEHPSSQGGKMSKCVSGNIGLGTKPF